MKHTIKQKFRRGASIAIALLIFLLCALAGVSALMMAASNAGRYSHKSEQEYYTVSSAALMIVDMFDGLKFTSQEVQYDYERTWNYKDKVHTESDKYILKILPAKEFDKKYAKKDSTEKNLLDGEASTLRKSDLTLCKKLQSHCEQLVRFLNIPEEWYKSVEGQPGAEKRPDKVDPLTYSFTISVNSKDGNGSDVFKPVKCTLEMGSNYNLLFSFQVENTIEGEEGDLVTGEYAITVYWQAEVDFVQKTGDPQYTYAEKDSAGEFVSGSMLQHRTLQVTAKWDRENVTISRGEAIKTTTEGEKNEDAA